MSGYNYSDPDDDFESGNSGGGLRKQLEQLLEENRNLRKLVEGDRHSAAEQLLKEQGIDPVVLQLKSEGEDPVEWVNRNAHLLGATKSEPEPQAKIDEPKVTAPAVEDPAITAEREAREAMTQAQEAGSQSVVETDLRAQMDKIDTEDELMAFFRAHGAPEDD